MRCQGRGIDCIGIPKHSIDWGSQNPVASEDTLQPWDGDILQDVGFDGPFDVATDGQYLEDIRPQGPELQPPDSGPATVPRPSRAPNEVEDLDYYHDSSLIVGSVSPWALALTSDLPVDFSLGNLSSGLSEFGDDMDSMQKAFHKSPFYSRSCTEQSATHPITMSDSACAQSVSANTWPVVPQIFDQPIRDGLLAVVVAGQGPAELMPANGITCNFPSAELMDVLADRFLTKQKNKLDCWIHTETYNPAAACPELTLMVLAAGALATRIFSLRQWASMVCKFTRRQLVFKVGTGCALPP